MTGSIDVEMAQGAICRIRLNRPGKRNALTKTMMQQLGEAVVSADSDPAVRALLLESTGSVFCAGADVRGLADNPPNEDHDPGHFCLMALAGARKPMVAAVQGAAVGMGATMLLHFDAVIATEQASLHMPFVELGLTPEGGSTILLPHRVGHILAARLLLFAEPLNGHEALAAGLFTRIVDADALDEAALKAAHQLSNLPPNAVVMTKAMLKDKDLLERMEHEQAAFQKAIRGPEFLDAIARHNARFNPRQD